MADFQSLDIVRRSASTELPPSIRAPRGGRQAHRRHALHRLQGLPGRPAWNGTTCATRSATSTAATTIRSTSAARTWTLMRFTEWENPNGRSRMADPQGRLHALRRSGLPQGLPGAGRDRAVRQRHRRFHRGELHRLRLLRQGLPVQHPAHSQHDHKAYKCTLCSDRVAVGQEPACAKACPTGAIVFGTKDDMNAPGAGAHRGPEVARLRQCRSVRSRRASAART